MYLRKLEKPFYHGTACSKISRIKEEGLRSIDYPVHVETYNYKNKRFAEEGVFITKNIETALTYAYDASKECYPELLEVCSANEDNMCIVKIDKLPNDVDVGPDGYGDLMTNGDIPPSCIKILEPRELRKSLGVDCIIDVI